MFGKIKKERAKRAIKTINNQINQIDYLKELQPSSPKFIKWRRNTEVAITNIFGKNSDQLNDFNKIKYTFMSSKTGQPLVARPIGELSTRNKFKKSLEQVKAILQSIIDEIQTYGIKKTIATRQGISFLSKLIEFVVRLLRL